MWWSGRKLCGARILLRKDTKRLELLIELVEYSFFCYIQKIEELKQLKQQKEIPQPVPPPEEFKQPKSLHLNGKRKSDKNLDDFSSSKKVSKFDSIAEFSKKEISFKQEKVKQEEYQTPVPIDPSLPQDFFDNNVKPTIESTKTDSASTTSEPLPKGFFDDPYQDAKARNINLKTTMDEQMELFRKEIASETVASENMVEKELELSQKEQNIIEIDQQMDNLSKVEYYQSKIEELHRKNKSKPDTNSAEPMVLDKQTDSDSDDNDDLDVGDFWRSKKIFGK